MNIETLKVAVSGGTPGNDSNDYKLFDSTVAFSSGLRSHNLTRLTFAVQNDHTGTLKAFWSANSGTTWNQYDSQSVAVPAANTSQGPYDYDLAPYDDFKLVWTNGGTTQGTWIVAITLLRDIRNPAT